MGHLYPENISKYLIHKLFRNWMDEEEYESGFISKGFLNNPKPLKIEETVQYFIEKINQMKRIIISQYKTEDIKLLKRLMEKEFGVNCAEGCYLDKDMLEMTINECLAIWSEKKYVKKTKDGWILDMEKYRKSGKELEDLYIKYIDM